jgi:hypothetical protein
MESLFLSEIETAFEISQSNGVQFSTPVGRSEPVTETVRNNGGCACAKVCGISVQHRAHRGGPVAKGELEAECRSESPDR